MSSAYSFNIPATQWTTWEKVLFRITFLFLLLLTIPSDTTYYKQLFSFGFHFQDFYHIGYITPSFFSSAHWGAGSFTGWLIAFVIAVAGAFVWGILEKGKHINYDALYYWTRVVLRYRLAIAFISAGLVLILPLQLPYPTISDLHTAYGDFLPWKIYYHSTAVATAGYRQTIGALEIIAAILLLYRKTVAAGALIITFVLVNVVLANFAYEIGDHLYSLYLLIVAIVLLLHDFQRLYAILVQQTAAFADRVQPVFGNKLGKLRHTLKIAFTVFVLLFTGLAIGSSGKDNWPYPNQPGLKDAAGFYNVSSFSLNDSVHPYSLTDTVRWNDVVFEKWNTLSVRTLKSHTPALRAPGISYEVDAARNYEAIGNGGRIFYRYELRGDSLHLSNSNDATDKLVFHLQRTATSVVLNGKDAKGQPLTVTLDKVSKEYLLFKGRRKPISIY